jgi:hypothetical protein
MTRVLLKFLLILAFPIAFGSCGRTYRIARGAPIAGGAWGATELYRNIGAHDTCWVADTIGTEIEIKCR